MKYNLKQQSRIKEAELQLSGETQKAVWSIIRQRGHERGKVIATNIQRSSENVNNVLKKLITFKMVDRVDSVRGAYKVSKYILEGEK